ncbi:TPA: MucBP domain-containing protein [Streptococcus suis]|nr:MucBP domain-containing protein [Streptococcus suis]
MKKNKKFVKLGVALLSTAVLSTASQCYSIPFLENTNVVYADESTPIAITVEAVDIGTHTSLGTFGSYTVSRDGSVTITAPKVEGYELSRGELLDGNGYYLDISAKGNVLTVNGSVLQESEKTGVARFYYHKLESNAESLPYTVEWYLDGQYYNGYTNRIKPGELHDRGVADKGGIPVWSDFADLAENCPHYYEITYEKVAAGENYYRFDLVSKDKEPVPYTIELVDQDGQVLQTIQQSGVEGTEVSFEAPVISGYRVGKTEGFDSWTYGKGGTFRLVANKTVKVYYDKAPSIDSLIRPEQRVEYQKVFDTFHTTVLKAFEVYKKELGVDDITYEANDLEKIFADSNLSVLHSELVLVQPLFAKPVGLVLTDQDIINAIGWTPDYWDYQISYHKEITQKLEKAMANIAASKAEPNVPVDQPITIKVVYRETQIEPGQKITPFKEETFTITPGESVTLAPKTFDGWKLVVGSEQTVTYEQAKRENSYYFEYVMASGNTQGDNPVDIPTEQPVGQPISVTFRFVDTEGNIIRQDISWSVSNGGTPAINEAPAIDGYELVDPTQEEMLVTYEQAKQNGVYIIRYTKKITPPSDNTNGSTVSAPKDKEKDSTSNSNISVGGDKQPTDNKKTEQLAVDTKEKAAASATDSKKAEKASSDTKTLPNTGQATSASEMTGFMMLGLAGLAFALKKRRRNS